MDDRRFDAITKSLGGGGSRRAVLKGLAGSALAAAAALRGSGASAGRACREFTRKCVSEDQCCGGRVACARVDRRKSVGGVISTCNLDGRRCCGIRGAFCGGPVDSCKCCRDLVCNPRTNRCDLPDLLP